MNRLEEILTKREKLLNCLRNIGVAGAVFSSQAMFSWYSAGGENRVVTASEHGEAYIVVTPDADFILTDNIEFPRIQGEAIPEAAHFVVESFPWHQPRALNARLAELTSGGSFVSDCALAGTAALPPEVLELTYRLLPPEIERYGDLGREASFAMEGACRRVEPGMTEEEISAVLCEEIYARGLVPVVVLVASDERINNFRHPLPTDKRLDSSLMMVLGARRAGLIASLTRLAYFGRSLPEELADRHRAVQAVDAAFILATREGRTVGEVFADGLQSYHANGYAQEWNLHHQGGPTGYQGRSYKATSQEGRKVLSDQAFAWNPSITGTKSEDTILVPTGGGLPRVLTPTQEWPVSELEWGGESVSRADILLL